MAGRITLVNSVLNSMNIHSMMILPIPSGILDKLRSILVNFIWDTGELKRRHWVSWNKLTLAKKIGGMGLKNPEDIHIALHGKLAWNYLQQRSLWARTAKNRFREGEKGSVVWNGFNHLLDCLRDNTVWRVGDGNISVGELCNRLKWRYPIHLYSVKVKDILDSNVWNNLTEYWPWTIRNRMQQSVLEDSKPSLYWLGANDGVFTVKRFWDSFQTRGNPLHWTEKLWNHHLHPKLACFTWRLFHSGIPTDDNIQKLGICVTSKCACCTNPCSESMDHLFFEGEWGSKLWHFLGSLFQKPLVHNTYDLMNIWFDEKQDYMSHLGSILAAAGIWEIWRVRNKIRNDEGYYDWLQVSIKWARKSAHLIKQRREESYGNRLILQALQIIP